MLHLHRAGVLWMVMFYPQEAVNISAVVFRQLAPGDGTYGERTFSEILAEVEGKRLS